MPTDFKGFKQGGNTIPVNDTTARNGVIANTKLIKDTVGWSGKNKYDTINGQQNVVITSEGAEQTSEGIYTTPYIPVTKNQIISYASKTGSSPVYRIAFYDSSKTFISRPFSGDNNKLIELPTNTAYIRLSVDNKTASPESYFTDLMIRDANILDDTYEPYFGSTAFPRSEQAVLGVKNLNGTVYTNKTTVEITWTVNADGSVRAVNSLQVAESRTNGESSTFVAPFNAQVKLSGGVDINHHIYPWDNTANSRPYTDSSKTTLQSNNADGNTIEFWMEKGHEYRMILRVNKNTQASDVTFYPMIRLASDPDDTYAPYAMTNKELTPAIFEATTAFTFDTNGKSITKQGKIVVPYLRVTGVTATADDLTTPICVVPEGCRPSFAKVFPIISSGTITSATLYTDGKIVAKTTLSNATVTISNPWSI